MKFYISRKITNLCVHCGFCETQIECPGSENCTGCGVCVDACPSQAKILEEVLEERKKVKIKVDGETYEVPEKITILKALEILGYKISYFPTKNGIYAPCRTGGCWACMVLVDGKPKQACITPVKNGMNIQTSKTELEKIQPLRIVSGFQGHPVGGVGTPYWLKPKGFFTKYIEVACFAHGCILRCPTCQNWEITYSSKNTPLTPNQAAVKITGLRKLYDVDRMAISGGESTLNYRWLIAYLKNLKKLNPDKDARFHVDTNAVILTKEYIDRLVEAGMTDIGPDIKALTLSLEIPKRSAMVCRVSGSSVSNLSSRIIRSLSFNFLPNFTTSSKLMISGLRYFLSPFISITITFLSSGKLSFTSSTLSVCS